MKRIAARGLPDAPLAAQAAFNAEVLPLAVAALEAGDDVLIAFDAADHTHREWRQAALAMLARAHVPARVNAVAGVGTALETAAAYLAAAPGVTGHCLDLSAGAPAAVPAPHPLR